MKPAFVVLAGLALAGCELIDQRTFAPSPEAAPARPAAAPTVDPRTPLVTIGFDTPTPHYQDLLSYAVHAADARDPSVQYDVVTVVPATGSAMEQVLAAGKVKDDAVTVMQTMISDGVSADRIHLGARSDANVINHQVRVYVRPPGAG
jgi:hypothetical protein